MRRTLIWYGLAISCQQLKSQMITLNCQYPSHLVRNELIATLDIVMHHNFYPSVLALGATAMPLHYTTILQQNQHCHIPFLTGESGTGKTTALRSGLSFIGAHEKRFFSCGTKEKYSLHCCECSIPISCDDPVSEANTGQLIT